MEPLPYYKWHWRDYRANRRVQRMSWQAKGLYRELLDEFWAEGCLPLDHAELADICGCTLEEFSKHWPEMEGCWEVTDGFLVNAKMDSMRTDSDSLRVKRAKSGKAGAIAKQVSASAEENQADAEQMPASAKQVLASASKCHIAEQSRAEQSITSRDKREADPRHVPFKEILSKAWHAKNSSEMPWSAGEGKHLASLLSANPNMTEQAFTVLLRNRHKSQVNHAQRPRAWLENVTDYANGPLDKFGKPLEGGSVIDFKPLTIAEQMAKRKEGA